MKALLTAVSLCFISGVNIVETFASEPKVPKLPQIPSGEMTAHGLDYKVPGPVEGLVPDKETATAIAEAVLFRLHGKKMVESQRPYQVVHDDGEGIWWVMGAGNQSDNSFKIAISSRNATVLYVANEGRIPSAKNGLVPDKETAVRFAEIVLIRLFGKERIVADRPYHVVQDENIWWLWGTNHSDFGGTFRIAISQQTAAVLFLEMSE